MTAKAEKPNPANIHYRVEAFDLHAHLFRITLYVKNPAATQVLQLPVWIPGSYLIREFSKNFQNLRCKQGKKSLPCIQKDKSTWEVQCTSGRPLELTYEIYAFDNSVRSAWLDSARGFFNGTSLFLQVAGQEHTPHTVDLSPVKTHADWQVATGLTPLQTNPQGFGTYSAESYEALVDCPVELGTFWRGHFTVAGIPHQLVVSGAPPSFDADKLLADTQTICEEEIRFWHPQIHKNNSKKPNKYGLQGQVPFKSYVFLLNAVHDGYGGLEHRNSTALICSRSDLPRLPRTTLAPAKHRQPEGYATLLGLISHEYFHTWNVKRLRPAEFTQYDFGRENYTSLLWFFEGFTSHYDELFLLRTTLLDTSHYLKRLSKTINQVLQTPGRQTQTVAQASFDAWVKYYRQDENTPNATVSYYNKGALVALCLDLTLRKEGHTTLDHVMRALWARCNAGPMTEHDLRAVLASTAGRSFYAELDAWVHSTDELPVLELLESQGIAVHRDPPAIAQQLGLRVKENHGIHIQQVLRGGAAEKAGFASGDEWLAVQTSPNTPLWRIQTLDDLVLYTSAAQKLTAWVARDRKIMALPLLLSTPTPSIRLAIQEDTRLPTVFQPN